jgi:Mannosyltransferase (PIG-V)
VFAFSRLVVFAAIAVSPWVIPPAPPRWDLDSPLLRPLFRWDAGWYLNIAQHGYSYNGNPAQQQNIVFLPLYPLTCRLCHLVTGISISVCAVLLSNLAFLIALAVLYILTAAELGPAVARCTVLLLAFFPASLFFSTMYTESFYLALSLLAYASFRQQRWLSGGLWAGLASATRVPGILLLVVLVCENLPRLRDRRVWWRVLPAGMLAASGLTGFMLYEWFAFGDPLANFRVQGQAWGREFAWPLRSLAGGLRRTVATHWSPLAFDAWLGLLFLALVGILPRHLPISYTVYTAAGLVLPLCTKVGLFGLTRYLAVLFPGFMALGIIGQRSRGLFWALLSVFTVTLVIFSMRYAQWHWVE